MSNVIKRKVTFYIDEPHPKIILAGLLKNKKVRLPPIREITLEKSVEAFEAFKQRKPIEK
ncbi:MAG: hypothetical protein WAN50_03620 [Minisyncoccia bacterium]